MEGEASFELTVDGVELPLDVIELEGHEGLDFVHRYRVLVVAPPYLGAALLGELEGAIGADAWLTLRGDAGARVVAGIVEAVERLGATADGTSLTCAVELASPLALLAQRARSQVFQELTATDIVARVLADWGLRVVRHLERTYTDWPYCVQYQETDLDFVLRTLAAEGIYAFTPPGLTPRAPFEVVLGDSPRGYVTGPRGEPLRLPTGNDVGEESISRLSRRRALRPTRSRVRDHQPEAPLVDVLHEDAAGVGDARLVWDEFLPARTLVGAPARPRPEALEALRRDEHVIAGTTGSRRLAPGLVVAADHPLDPGLAEPFVVTQIHVRGHAPRASGRTDSPFVVTFQGRPAEQTARPPRPAPRRASGLDSAVVVGATGQDTATDALGRVRVQFRWNLDEPPSPTSSAWLRVAQAWAGQGFGAFFLPRVGMEVLVGYLGGDVDRPIVVGCVPNGANLPPFRLPAEAARSGIVTRSSPSGDGGHELLFEDSSGMEEVRLRSARDLVAQATRDGSLAAQRDLAVTAGAELHLRSGARADEVATDLRVSVGGQTVARHEGPVRAIFGAPVSAELAAPTAVTSRAELAVTTETSLRLDARGALELRAGVEAFVRSEGSALVQVGTHDRPAPLALTATGGVSADSPRTIELRSDLEVRLVCGESALVLTPGGIQLHAKKVRLDADELQGLLGSINLSASDFARVEADRVFVLSSGASLALVDDARLKGSSIKLGAPPDESTAPEALAPTPPTTRISLADEDGAPLAGARFVVTLEDGTERLGALDAEGRASLRGLEGAATLSFPDIPEWEPA